MGVMYECWEFELLFRGLMLMGFQASFGKTPLFEKESHLDDGRFTHATKSWEL